MKRKLYQLLTIGSLATLGLFFINAADLQKNLAKKKIKIGIIPVVETNINFKDYEFCYKKTDPIMLKSQKYMIDAFQYVGMFVKGTCDNLNKKGSKRYLKGSKTVSVYDALYGTKNIKLTNVQAWFSGRSSFLKGDQTIYPLTQIGDYWNKLLEKHQIKKTLVGENIELQTLVHKPIVYRGKFNSQTEWVKYLDEALDSEKFDRTQFDFVVPVYMPYICNYDTSGLLFADEEQLNCYTNDSNRHARATVSNVNKTAYIDSDINEKMTNSIFETTAHELGHLLFGLNDTYYESTSGLKYPEGMPHQDLSILPSQTQKVCLMSGRLAMPNKKTHQDKSGFYIQNTILPTDVSHHNLPSFYLDDPYNFDLCPYDLELFTDSEFKGSKRYSTLAVNSDKNDTPLNCSEDVVVSENAGLVPLNVALKKVKIHPIENTQPITYEISVKALNLTQDKDFELIVDDKVIKKGAVHKLNLPSNQIFNTKLNVKVKFIDNSTKQKSVRYAVIYFKKTTTSRYELGDKKCITYLVTDND